MRVLISVIVLTTAVGGSVPTLAVEATPQPLTRADCKKAGMQWNDNANVCGGKQIVAKPGAKPNKPRETTTQPLTRADCKKAGMQWNDNANVCGGKQAIAKPEAQPNKPQKK
jgi:hypothetical protein